MFAPGIERLRRATHWIFILCLCAAPAFAVPTKLGDLNSDGVLDVFDLTRLREHIRQTNALPQGLVPFADITADGFINEDDSVALIYMIVGASPEKALPLDAIRETSPFAGESGVALTREVIVRFAMPLSLNAVLTTWDPNTQTPGTFYAEAGGRKLLTRVELSGDRLKATLFFLEIVPASTRVLVTFNGAGLNDLLERPMDPDGDGAEGGVRTFTYDTAPIAPVIGTGIIGHVYASERATGQTTDTPLPGVLVRVVGSEDLFTYTAADGSFSLNPCPAGRFFVEVDGRTSTLSNFPDGAYYPYINKPWETLPGKADNLAAGTGIIYLPLVVADSLQPVSTTATTTIRFPPSVIDANPALAGVEIYVPPNSLFADDGTRGGKVGLAPVASDRLPEPLPPGLNHALDISIQTDGATNFDRPVPVRFPNLPDPVTGIRLPPGAKSALWSYNHDKGTWEIAGPMTVTQDGNFVVTDAGVGVRQPGWHGAQPGCQVNGLPPRPDCQPEAAKLAQAEADLAKALQDLEGLLEELSPLNMLTDEAYDAAQDQAFDLLEIRKTNGRLLFDGRSSLRYKNIHFKKYIRGLGKLLKLQTLVTSGVGCIRDLNDDLTIASLAGTDCEQAVIEAAKLPFREVGFWAGKGIDATRIWAQNARLLLYQRDVDKALEEYNNCRSTSPAFLAATGGTFARATIPTEILDPVSDSAAVMIQAGTIANATATTQLPIWTNLVEQANNAQPIADRITAYEADHSAPAPTIGELRLLLGNMNSIASAESQLFDTYPIDLITGLNLAAIDDFLTTGGEVSHSAGSQSQFNVGKCFCLLRSSDGFDQRFLSNVGGAFARNLTPNTFYHFVMLDPVTLWIGETFFLTDDDGGSRITPGVVLGGDHRIDTDQDGLSDAAEDVVGTDPNNADTDNDGISDGAEVRNGTNPLDGIPSATGIIGTIDTPGNAKDIVAQNTVALVADGNEGVSVFNVANSLNPVRTAQIRLTGSTEAVALDGTLAAATGSNLALLDLSDLSAVRVMRQLFLGGVPRSVAAAGGIAYAGLDNGQVVAVDMAVGGELERRQVSTEPIQDLSFARDVLYARSSSRVYAIEFAPTGMTVAGSVAVTGTSAGRQRLFAGVGLAYAPMETGYTILSLADPLHPTVAQTISVTQRGWREFVPTGSGLGLGIFTNFGAADVHLYNVGTSGTGSQFLTTFTTPGDSQAVSIYNGLAYIADGDAGLTVVNYKAYDALGLPPTISISTGFPSVGGALQAEEGKLGRVTAAVTDDVQVRNVEFYLDGQLAITDGNFPFEHRFVTPLLAPDKTSFTLRAKATDTGGNSTWSGTLTVTLVPDATPPRVLRFLPPTGSFTGSLRNIAVTFSEPINQATLTPESLAITGTGPDGVFNTADDFTPTGGGISYREPSNTAFISFSQDLAPSLYRLVVRPPVADLAGNAIASPAQSQFRVFSFQDSDGDGIPDDIELLLGLDPHNPDSDGNGIRDGDEDYDNDGLGNAAEIAYGLDPFNPDSNGNGILDGDEDPDHDGLSNRREALAGTDPNNPDTDGDGWNDETEITGGSNPLDPLSRPKSLIVGAPHVNIVRIGDLAAGLLRNGSVMAQPPVFAIRTASDPNSPNGSLGSAAFLATPTLFTFRQVFGEPDPNAGAFIATPLVYVARYDQPIGASNWLSGAIQAQPPVTVIRPTSDPGGVNGGLGGASFIATPNSTVLRLDISGLFLAQPPITIEIQNQ